LAEFSGIESVLLRNFMLLLLVVVEAAVVLDELASFLHFFRIC
jgi:hypothetical protein